MALSVMVLWSGVGPQAIGRTVAADAPTLTALAPASGPTFGGTAVVLTGTGFTEVTGVRFGNDPAASFRIDSDTQITAVTPAHAAAAIVDLVVATATASSMVTPDGRYTYYEGAWAQSGSVLEGPRQRLAGHQALLLDDGRTLVMGGTDSVEINRSADIYDPGSRTWSVTGSMVAPRARFSATLLSDHRILVVGGSNDSGVQASAELYDPVRGTWSSAMAMPVGRYDHSATLLANGEVLVAGGAGATGAQLPSALLFDPATNAGQGSWRAAGSMSRPRNLHTATLLGDGAVLVTGGGEVGESPASPSDVFTPGPKGGAGAWRVTGAMSQGRKNHMATRLLDGRVLVSGGAFPSASAEIYDQTGDGGRGTWQLTSPMSSARVQATAILLEHDCGTYCGRVMVVGGIADAPAGPEDLATTELFNILDGNWSPGPTMRVSRVSHVSASQRDGRVLVAGGTEGGVVAEMFDQEADRPAVRVDGVSPVAGPTRGGTTLTVTGAGFFPDASVRVGRHPVPVTFLSDTLLTVTTPPSAQGVVEVSVTARGATSEPSDAATFTYQTSSWSATAPTRQPPGRYAHNSVLLDPVACHTSPPLPNYPCGQVLMAGGTTDFTDFNANAALKVSDVYNPSQGSWTRTGTMGRGRFDFTATLIDGSRCAVGIPPLAPAVPCGHVLVAGGRSGANAVNTAELYNPVGATWSPTATSLNEPRLSHTSTLLDGPMCRGGSPPRYCGMVLVAGGATKEIARPPLASAELFDPATGVWQPTGTMVTARTNHTATLLDGPECRRANPPGHCGKVLLVGGLGPDGNVVTCDKHIEQRVCPSELVLVSAELYDPGTGMWSPTGSLSVGRVGHTATALDGEPCGLNCGKVMAAGGVHGYPWEQIDSTELYDPAAGTWSATASALHVARGGHTATLLGDGTVLATGGALPFHDTRIPSTASTEVFDPVTSRWARTPSLTEQRGRHSANLLSGPACRTGSSVPPWCGTVLVSGGYAWSADRYAEIPDVVEPDNLYAPNLRVIGLAPTGGPSRGGGQVTIYGSRFYDVEAVSIGGIPTSFTVRSPTEISAIIPRRQSGAAEVVVETAEGTSAALKPRPSTLYEYGVSHLPDRVENLVATAVSDSAVDLIWAAPASDGEFPPPASSYVVKQSPTPITDQSSFDAATTLCGTRCEFVPRAVGEELRLAVADLAPATTYHYAVRAVNDIGAGPISEGVSVTTTGTSVTTPACSGETAPGPGQVSMAGGRYSLVGFPGGTTLGAGATLYGWFDQGAGTDYTSHAGGDPLVSGRGYWAWSPCSRVVDLFESATSASMPLAAYHASMVGNPSANGPAQVAGHDFAATWDPTSQAYHLSDYRAPLSLAVGQGAWVFSFVPTRITIEPSR